MSHLIRLLDACQAIVVAIERYIQSHHGPILIAIDGGSGAGKSTLAALLERQIFIYDPIAPDPEGIINQGHGNQTARAIQVRRGETLNKQAFITLIQAVVANNRAGGWRKLKRNSETRW